MTLAAVVFGVWLAQFSEDPMFVLTAAALAVGIPFVWHRPQLGLYVLVGAGAAIETFRLRFPDSLTDVIPFFRSLDSLGSPLPAPFSPGELLVLMTVGIVVLKRLAARQTPLEASPLFPPLAILLLLVVFAFVRGVGAGGDMSAAIAESRTFFYFGGVLLLTYNLVHRPGQARLLLWILLGVIALKGLLGMWRFLVTANADLSRIGAMSPNTNALFSHEESFFFAFFFLFITSMFLFRAGKTQRFFSLVFLLPVALSLLANERRAGFAILLVGIAVIVLAAFVFEPSRRKVLASVAIIALVLLPPYLAAFGGASGVVAQPARAVMSVFQPDERDLSSNVYRLIEYENVRLTILESPILGAGFGIPFTMHEPLPDISDHFTLWDTVPHNSLIWLWLRLGVIGVIVFWFLVARILVTSAMSARGTPDPYLRATSVLAMAVLVGWLVMGVLDMGLVTERLGILAGVLVGLAARVPLLTQPSAAVKQD